MVRRIPPLEVIRQQVHYPAESIDPPRSVGPVLRRLPWMFGMHTWIRQIREIRHAIFVGFFGPIGVSAIFYLFISIEFIEEHLSDDSSVPREGIKDLAETSTILVWFLAVCSIVSVTRAIYSIILGYLAPRIHRVLSESFSGSLSNRNSIEPARTIPVIGRLFSPPLGDPEAYLATGVRQGIAPMTRTRCEALPSKIKESDQETRGEAASGSSVNETSEGPGARTDGEAQPGGSRDWNTCEEFEEVCCVI